MEDNEKNLKVDVSLGFKHPFLKKVSNGFKSFDTSFVRILRRNRHFFKQVLKLLVGILFMVLLGLIVYSSVDGYKKQIIEKKERMLRRHLNTQLNDFDNPDSICFAAIKVFRGHLYIDENHSIDLYPYEDNAISNLTELAENNYVEAQFILGQYYSGYNFSLNQISSNPQVFNYEKSAYWYLQAAKRGHRIAMNNLGNMYQQGIGVKQNLEKALYWYRKATMCKDAYGALNLGDLFRDGIRVKIDPLDVFSDYKDVLIANIDSAKYYWKLADERGCPVAKERLQKVYD